MQTRLSGSATNDRNCEEARTRAAAKEQGCRPLANRMPSRPRQRRCRGTSDESKRGLFHRRMTDSLWNKMNFPNFRLRFEAKST
ncbi:hypothetical protein NPIL_466021 [Nephila pilipes]|uniref:Uncharacterized protein n=1 Tax=Nephila pilipes TaxID=299642 RepID=A0A8X6PKT4_NEPPI|nr:hypothetical protein NPIL_466021 [Nephila pilipes]